MATLAACILLLRILKTRLPTAVLITLLKQTRRIRPPVKPHTRRTTAVTVAAGLTPVMKDNPSPQKNLCDAYERITKTDGKGTP